MISSKSNFWLGGICIPLLFSLFNVYKLENEIIIPRTIIGTEGEEGSNNDLISNRENIRRQTTTITAATAAAGTTAAGTTGAEGGEKGGGILVRRVMKESIHEEGDDDDADDGVCMSWPFSSSSLPLGPTATQIADGHNGACTGMSSILWESFAHSFPTNINNNNINNRPKIRKHKLSKTVSKIDCSDYPPSTLLMMQHANDKRLPYFAIRQCMAQSNNNNNNNNNNSTSSDPTAAYPFITFRTTPKESILGPSELSTKSGLAEHVQRYLSCDPTNHHHHHDEYDENSGCIMPQTFSISQNGTDCQRFFDLVKQDNNHAINNNTTHTPRRLWVKKPLKGSGGIGIERLHDPIKQLKNHASYCHDDNRRRTKFKQIVVQEYIPPKLILDGRSFHIRAYFLFKYASLAATPTTTTTSTTTENETLLVVDPPQAWHIPVGNIHVCSEPYSMIHHKDLGQYAVKCNRHAWDENPRIQKEGGRIAYIAKTTTTTQNNTNNNNNTYNNNNISFRYPYPQFFQQTFTKQEYTTLMKRINTILQKTAIVIQSKAQETKTYGLPNEALWTIIGTDLIIDQNLRPWLLETNICPGSPLHGAKIENGTRNPYLSIYRIIMTHYQRQLMKMKKNNKNNMKKKKMDHNNHENDENEYKRYHENACSKDGQLDNVFVSRVL